MRVLCRLLQVGCCTVVGAIAGATPAQQPGPVADRVATEGFVTWARPRAIPLQPAGSSPATPLGTVADLESLREVIGAARVVALGEPTHGAHEPLALRNHLFTWLVEQLHFTAIALESGLCESRDVSDFALGHPGDAVQVARDGLTWGFGGFEENVELIRWIRDYNADSTHPHKIKFYGIDLCGGDAAGFSGASTALTRPLAYLARVAPTAAPHARATLEAHLQQFTDRKYRSLAPAERRKVRAALEELRALLVRQRKEFVASSTETDFEWALREVVVAQSLERAFAVWPLKTPATGVSAEFYQPATIRDATMAQNVRWVLAREGQDGRILLYAHNGHVQNGVLRGGLW